MNTLRFGWLWVFLLVSRPPLITPCWDRQECLPTAPHLASEMVWGREENYSLPPSSCERPVCPLLPLKPPWKDRVETSHYPWMDVEIQATHLFSTDYRERWSSLPLSRDESLASFTFSYLTLVGRLW